jgi:hypothetical protein
VLVAGKDAAGVAGILATAKGMPLPSPSRASCSLCTPSVGLSNVFMPVGLQV